ncbi:MAG: hypothetical protein ACOC0D_00720 [Spirochaeta sp.]
MSQKGDTNYSWWEERSLLQKILLGIAMGIGGLALAALFGFVVMLLWNRLMPEIFGLQRITYWQAWGLFLLSTLLFKGFGGDNSSSCRSTDRKRRKELRRYMNEDQQQPLDGDGENRSHGVNHGNSINDADADG